MLKIENFSSDNLGRYKCQITHRLPSGRIEKVISGESFLNLVEIPERTRLRIFYHELKFN